MESPERSLTPYEWYDTARAKAETIIRRLDPTLRVKVIEAIVTDAETGQRRDTLALAFESSNDPRVRWTMEIGMNHEYIDTRLEKVIELVYRERMSTGSGG